MSKNVIVVERANQQNITRLDGDNIQSMHINTYSSSGNPEMRVVWANGETIDIDVTIFNVDII